MARKPYSTQPVSPHEATGEDLELGAFLRARIAEVLSPHHEPLPGCPRCGGSDVRTFGRESRMSGRRPVFYCRACRSTFRRVYGTPFYRRAYMHKLDQLIPLLSLPLSFSQAGDLTGSLPADIHRRVLELREWLLRLDPTGQWERRIRLGGRLAEVHPEPLRFSEAGACEDTELTARLTAAFDEINGLSPYPVPSCPWCGSRDVRMIMGDHVAFPRFECWPCRRNFSRRTGTVFAKTKRPNLEAMRQTIRYLSLPLPYRQVADALGILQGTYIERWRHMFAALADELAPDGSLSSRIRLGVVPTPDTPCPYCGRTGCAKQRRDGAWWCTGCGRLFSMRRPVIERDGRLEIDGVPEAAQLPQFEAEPGTGKA